MEFLNSVGYETPRGINSIISIEMYEEVIKKFDQKRWNKYQELQEIERENAKRRRAEEHREQEIQRILREAPKVEVPPLIPPSGIAKPEVTKVGECYGVESMEVLLDKKRRPTPPLPPIIEEEKVQIEKPPTEKITQAKVPKEKGEAYKIASKDRIVAEALEMARRKPKVTPTPITDKDKEIKAETKEEAAEAKPKKKRGRRRKKPRRPDVLVQAAVEKEMEKRVKIKKRKVEAEETAVKKTHKRIKRKKIDFKEIDASIKETLAKIEERGKGKKHRRKTTTGEIIEEEGNILHITEFISAQEMANLMNVAVTDIIRKAMGMGLLISINQRLDKDAITVLADEFGYSVNFISTIEEEISPEEVEEVAELKPRPPVVTVMGHVDHGKTSLLDFIRKSNIIAGESGAITQHIGAYKVQYDNRFITFLDTPGHEAFTAMRARGAGVTDIVVLVIAADDQVQPQTWEAINHAQAANVPIVIAINKIDKPNADPTKVRQQLADRNILVEDWGGKYQVAEISAKFGQGVPKLMEEILLLADLLELKSPVETLGKGVVIDSKLDKGRGPIATILVQKGLLKVGDYFVAGGFSGKIRALLDERGHKLESAGPSDPVQVLGFDGTPQAGEFFIVTLTEKEAKNIGLRRQQIQREQSFRQLRKLTLDSISNQIKQGQVQDLPLIIKGDVHGSVEAIADSLMKLQTEEVKVNVIHKGVGAVTESDVLLAAASNAVIIGFHIHANKQARESAQREQVEIKSYRVIYDVIDDVKKALEGMLRPEISEEILGELEVRNTFKITAVGTIAGCYVTEGKIERLSKIKVFHEGVEVFDGELESLKRFKDDAREVSASFECGLKIKNFNDIKVGDIIQTYKLVETKRTLLV
jgi:translation initiation factor IF-2